MRGSTMQFIDTKLLLLVLLVSQADSRSQESFDNVLPPSPCPSVFSYEGREAEADRWHGVVLVTTSQLLTGLRLDVKLSRPASVLGNWDGEVATQDNVRFTILNLDKQILPGPPTSVRIFVTFNVNDDIPYLKTIALNGRQICPSDQASAAIIAEPSTWRPASPTKNTAPFVLDANYQTSSTIRPDHYDYDSPSTRSTPGYDKYDRHSTRRTTEYNGYETPSSRPNYNEYDTLNRRTTERYDSNQNYNEFQNSVTKRTTREPYSDNEGYETPTVQRYTTEGTNSNNFNSGFHGASTARPQPDSIYPNNDNNNGFQNPTKEPHTANGSPNNNNEFHSPPREPQSDNRNSNNNGFQNPTTRRPTTSTDDVNVVDNWESGQGRPHNNNNNDNSYNSDNNNNNNNNNNRHPGNSNNSGNSGNRHPGNSGSSNNSGSSGNRNPGNSGSSNNSGNNGNRNPGNSGSSNNSGSSGNRNPGNSGSSNNSGNNGNRNPGNSGSSNNSGNSGNRNPGNSGSSNNSGNSSAKHPGNTGNRNPVNTGSSNKPTTSNKNKGTTTRRTTTVLPDEDAEWITTASTTKKPTSRTTKRPSTTTKRAPTEVEDMTRPPSAGQCGRVHISATPLITHGQTTSRGQWPWHVAVYQSKEKDLAYICGGSLVSPLVVVTAAHCVTKFRDHPVDPDMLVIYLGKYHLKLWSEGGVQDKQVKNVHIHPSYNSSDFRSDVALIILSSAVELTQFVRPICLWGNSDIDMRDIENKEGYVVGWGYDERGQTTEELMMAKMPIVSQQTCIWSYPEFFSHFTSNKTYCAGFKNGTSVCNGDSGGGMVFPQRQSDGSKVWRLRGLVSISVSKEDQRVCDTSHYVVFTDLAKHQDWINNYIK